jgi:hypothetical protein
VTVRENDRRQLPLTVETDTPASPFIREVIKRHLAALALLKTPENIASFLRGLGFFGERREHDQCPLTSYLRSATRIACISVCAADTMHLDAETDVECIPNPKPVAQFVARFDRGCYPWLERVIPEGAGPVKPADSC